MPWARRFGSCLATGVCFLVRCAVPLPSRIPIGLGGGGISVLASLAFGATRLLMRDDMFVLCLALCHSSFSPPRGGGAVSGITLVSGLVLPLPSHLTWSLGPLGSGFLALGFQPDFCFLLFNVVETMLFGRGRFALPGRLAWAMPWFLSPSLLQIGGGGSSLCD